MFPLILFTFLFTSVRALTQSADCDFSTFVNPDQKYYIYNTEYPGNYTAGSQCRWIAFCPQGYHCRLQCNEVELPKSRVCLKDRLLVSRTGNSQLAFADVYCGRGKFKAVSTEQTLSIGLISSRFSTGGRFLCELDAVKADVAATCQCGYKKKTRIVGGEETGINEYPLMAGLVDITLAKIICGAAIISHRYLLTAAHCAKRPREELGIVVGEHNTEIDDSRVTKAYRVMKIIVHPQFDRETFDYDIAVIQIAGRMLFNEGVGPVCLPFKFVNKNLTGENVTLIGWGTLFPGGPTSQSLQKVDVQIVDQEACKQEFPTTDFRQFCTYTPGKDSCQGDSGGPVLYTDPESDALFNLGIVSSGRLCASAHPARNTNVASLLDWITKNTPGAKYCYK